MSNRQCPASMRPAERRADDGCCEACGAPATMAIEVQFGQAEPDTFRACEGCRRRAYDNLRTFLRACTARVAATEREPA